MAPNLPSTPLFYIAAGCSLLLLIFSIASTASPFWESKDGGVTGDLYLFKTTYCIGGSCGAAETQVCDPNQEVFQRDEYKGACSQFSAMKGLSVTADLFSFAGLAGFALTAIYGVENKLFIILAGGFTFLTGLFEFCVMCIAVSFRSSPIFTLALQSTFKNFVAAGGFYCNVVAWIVAGAATALLPFVYKALV